MDEYYDDPDYDPNVEDDTESQGVIIGDTEDLDDRIDDTEHQDDIIDDPGDHAAEENDNADEVIYYMPSDDDGSNHDSSESENEGNGGPAEDPAAPMEPGEDMQMSPPHSPEGHVTLLTADYPQPFGQAVIKSTPKKIEVNAACAQASKDESMDEDSSQTCTICFEPWTNFSDHRLVSLRCGHLFGRSCITRWLKGRNARCPQCNAIARKSEIRNIYAKAIKVMDSTERDKALQDLKKESELRRKAEMMVSQERLKHMMAVQECERLKRELMEANKLLQDYRSGLKNMEKPQASKQNLSVYSLEKSIEIAKYGGCRIVDVCDLLGMALVTQPSINDLFAGYGFRKISTVDMKPSEFVLVHQKPIRDMAFHTHDGLVLTASLDKSVKITNILTNSVVHSYSVDHDVWSCSWDSDDPTYFYAGLKSGDVYLYDIRVTNRYVHELPRFGSKTPVVALQYLKKPSCSPHRKSGPVVGKLSDCGFYQKGDQAGDYKVIPLPTIGPFTSLSSEPLSGHFLVSSRPSPKQPRVTHTVCELVSDQSRPDLTCNPVYTIQGGRTQVQLTRSKLLPHPDDASSLLICAGDEDANGALIWDISSGKCLDQLRTESPVLDLANLSLNHKSHLFALTDKTLRLYGWNNS